MYETLAQKTFSTIGFYILRWPKIGKGYNFYFFSKKTAKKFEISYLSFFFKKIEKWIIY